MDGSMGWVSGVRWSGGGGKAVPDLELNMFLEHTNIVFGFRFFSSHPHIAIKINKTHEKTTVDALTYPLRENAGTYLLKNEHRQL